MHIGKNETDSKLKAMYFPPSPPKKMSEPTNEPTIATATATDATSFQNSPTNSSTTISNTTPTPTDPDSNSDPLYTIPTPYDVADGFISFTDSFLYLGTLITPDLRDETDVRLRIKKATAQVNTLRPFFRHPDIDLETKTSVYMATALNTTLWGCKAWTITDSIKRALQVLHHHSLRTILNINMFEVKEQSITNAQTQIHANVPDILIFLMRRSLRWIGKLARMPMNRLPRQLLAAWVKNPRKRGRPQSSLPNTMIESLQKALQDQVSQHMPLSEWIETAQDEKLWNDIIDEWHKVTCQVSFTDFEL
jgi:hypothetical protein